MIYTKDYRVKKVSCPTGKWALYQTSGLNRGIRGCYSSKVGAHNAIKRIKSAGRDAGAAGFYVMKGPFTGTPSLALRGRMRSKGKPTMRRIR